MESNSIHKMGSDSESFRARVMRSTAWTLVNFGSQQAIRLGSNLILTRLLVPDMFGLMAIAQVFVAGLAMFSDIGINTSIVKHQNKASPSFLNTAWTLQIVRGVLVAIACVALAYPISIFYNEPILFPVMALIALNPLIQGFQSTGFATSEKNLTIGKKTTIEIGCQLLGISLMIAWSAFNPTIWALVYGGIFSSIASVFFGHWILSDSHKHSIFIEKQHFDEIITFGKWIFVSSIIGFFANQMDKLILGKLFTLSQLGVYTVAYNLAQIPGMVNRQISTKVMLPVYSKFQDVDIETFRSHALKMRIRTVALTLPPALLLMLFGEEVIDILYDDRYQSGGWMLEALALATAITVATNIGPFLLSRGESKTFTLLVAVRTIIVFVCVFSGWKLYSTAGIIYSFSIANIVSYSIESIFYARKKIMLWKLDLSLLAIVLVFFLISKEFWRYW